MADHLMNVLISEGIIFHLNSSILGVRDIGNEKEVTIKDNGGKTLGLRAETILVAAGRQANLKGTRH